jgi:hypothetical protein
METRAAALESRDARLNQNPDSIPKECNDTFPRIGQSTSDSNSVNVSSNFESFAATVQAKSAELDSRHAAPGVEGLEDKLSYGLGTEGGPLNEHQCLQAAAAAGEFETGRYQEQQCDHVGLQVGESNQIYRRTESEGLDQVSADYGNGFWEEFINPCMLEAIV